MDENNLKRIKVDKIYQTTTTLDTTKHQNDRQTLMEKHVMGKTPKGIGLKWLTRSQTPFLTSIQISSYQLPSKKKKQKTNKE